MTRCDDAGIIIILFYFIFDLFDKIYASKEKGFKPAVIFLDINKAFDTVKHDNLLDKLKHYGISGTVYSWFKSYLSNRFQSTRWGRRISIALLINNMWSSTRKYSRSNII